MINRINKIKAYDDTASLNEYSKKINIGMKQVQDAVLALGDHTRENAVYNKRDVLDAIHRCDYNKMRQMSNYFYRVSGIYHRLCRYMAYMYRYDWVVTPYINSDKAKDNTILEGFDRVLSYLDNFAPKKFFGEVALKVMKNGCYYGYLIPGQKKVAVQELPPKYCRSRWISADGAPLVEFNMAFFDSVSKDAISRMRVLDTFPPEFKKGYLLYKAGKLRSDCPGDGNGWYLLEPGCVVKFNINGEDYPFFMSVIPAILDLDAAQGLDKKKMQQQLMKILVQKLPIDKNGDLVFDPDEAQVLHNNAVHMLSRAVGLDVLTTFAEVDVADTSDTNAAQANDSMDRVKQAVFDEGGVSQMQFNTDGNIALEKSILNDEAAMYNLIQQFESFLNQIIAPFNQTKKIEYRVQLLLTTIYNYKQLAKLYKENTQMGYSKMLPQIALGQSQRAILATAHFENEVLDLINVFIPPLTSNVMSADMLNRNKTTSENSGGGRPTNQSQGKPVSEKTMQNAESKS